MEWIKYILIVSMLACILGFSSLSVQYRFQGTENQEAISLHAHATLFDAENADLSIEDVVRFEDQYDFIPFEMENLTVGFSDHHLWVKVGIENPGQQSLKYYFETGRPITDYVELYLIENGKVIQTLINGDAIPFEKRSFPHRKVLFPLEFPANSQYEIYIHYKSDGEVVNLPLVLRSDINLIQNSYFEQLVYGGFYGIMILAVITYLFFFFALKDKSFLYYCFYVSMAGLLQFSLDGFFYQYFDADGGWIGRHAVIISGFSLGYYFMRYTQVFLKLSQYLKKINTVARVLNGVLIGSCLIFLLFPSTFRFAYPAANLIGVVYLFLILGIIATYYKRGYPIDHFFAIGISILLCSFIFFFLRNLSVLPNSFLSENSVKFGTGLEVIFLSLSMGNRIRLLKSEKEKLQGVALKKSEEMNELKSYFLSNMSHELRTPLNAIMGMTDVLMKEIKNPQILHKCTVIKNASLGLLSSVNNILDFSKIEKGELRLENIQFEPFSIIDNISKNAEQNAKEKGLAFNFEHVVPPNYNLIGDPMRLSQIVNNILENAVKFTSDGEIDFKVNGELISEDSIKLSLLFSDTGIGIEQHKLEDIFESLMQDDISHTRKFGGFGLGLFLTKAIVDAHNGSIKVKSKSGEGTTFEIKIQYKAQQIQTKEIKHFPSESKDLLGTKVLLVEDNIVNQMVMKAILSKWENIEVFIANHGEEAISILKENEIGMILMDLQMPVMDGYEATLAIRKGEAGPQHIHTPIIAITADVEESSRRHALSIGMDDYMTKPVNADLMYEKITEALSANTKNRNLVL